MPAEATDGIGGRVAHGATFMVLLRLTFRVIGLVSTLILVRVLAPEDFGLVAIAMVAYSILDMLSDLSFKLALVRMTSPQRIHYDTAWTLGVLRGGLIAAILIAAAPFLAGFIRDARAENLIYALAALALIQGFENVRVTELHRNMQFDRLFWYQLGGKIAGFAAVVPAALILQSYWALFYGIAATRVVLLVSGYLLVPYRPRFSFAGWAELFDFSKWILITNVLWAIDAHAMTFVIGKIAGPSALGTFQVAREIAVLPASEVASPAREPIFAGYARVQHDRSLLRQHFLDGFALMVAIIAPLSFGIFVTAEPITTLLLGSKWSAAAPLIQLCAFYGFFDAIGHFTHNLFMVLQRQRMFVMLLTLTLLVRLPAIVLAGYAWGVHGAVFALVCSAAFNMLLWNAQVAPMIGASPGDFLRCTWRTVAACAAMSSAVAWLLAAWSPPADLAVGYVRFAVACAAGAAVQVSVQYGLWYLSGKQNGPEVYLLRILRAAFRRVFAVSSPRIPTPTT